MKTETFTNYIIDDLPLHIPFPNDIVRKTGILYIKSSKNIKILA